MSLEDFAFTYIDYSTMRVTEYSGSATSVDIPNNINAVDIPNNINGQPVTTIGKEAFKDCKWIANR